MKKGQKGPKHSLEARERHRLAVLGSKHPMWGKHHTEEAKEKKRIASINMWKDPNSRVNTKEYRESLSKSISGKNHPMYGKHHSIESNNKRKDTMKNNWKDLTSTFNTSLYKEKRSILHKKHKNTEPELKVKSILDKLNIEYESQKMIYPYPIDFFIPSCNLCIEVDGTYSHGDPRKYKLNDLVQGGKTVKIKWEKDKKRDEYLESLGYKTIRFWEYDINKDLNLIEELIKISIIQNS